MSSDSNNIEKAGDLVQIGSSAKGGMSRRSFLKVLGASAATVGIAGCADDKAEKILPNIKGDETQIPGVAVWFRSTCTECSAGCGFSVRTREGRAVKVEGSPDNPINNGGLCALGQSSLQNLYDPDRIRQPLMRERGVDSSGRSIFSYKPISWDDAYSKVIAAYGDKSKKKAFIVGETTGALDELITDFAAAGNADVVTWDALQPIAVAQASDLVYGEYGIPQFYLDRAEVVVNFGADFLETWVSPVEFGKQWARSRKKATPTRYVHIEPRLSLTGANADLPLSPAPGSELAIALYLLKRVTDAGRWGRASNEVRGQIATVVKDSSLEYAAAVSGISKEKLLLIADYLINAKSSLVLAGGTAASTAEPLPLLVAANLLNVVLGNIGTTVDVTRMRKPKSSLGNLHGLFEQMKRGDIKVLFLYGTNPAFTVPSSFGWEQARNMVPLVVSFSSHLDETTAVADLILPSHHSLEAWGDVRVVPGVYSLTQPTMLPVFDTRAVGDSLITIATKAGQKIAGDATSFQGYLKESWKKLHSVVGAGGPFEKFWLEAVERGVYVDPRASAVRSDVAVKADAFKLAFNGAPGFEGESNGDGHGKAAGHDGLLVYPYYSVRTFDGRAANRPWLQEIPDPMTTIVWNNWAEVHPDTAKKFHLEEKDFVTIRTKYGEVNVPVYLTPFVRKDIIAVPIGHGHSAYGRYATEVGGGNVISLLANRLSRNNDGLALLSTRASVARGRGKAELLILQGNDSQEERGIARTSMVAAGAGAADATHAIAHEEAHPNAAHGEHHDIKQMYQQREHPLYHWGMAVDLAACTGCSACVVACYAENNIPIVGKKQVYKGREMSWLRIERYIDGGHEELSVSFVPMMCQHCNNAPCEPVCPVFATYHNEEGMNVMTYNRCVGTRYCSNNCSYKVRRFNWYHYDWPEPLNWQLNPDVTKRTVGIMEKCTFCVQRIMEAKDRAKDLGRLVEDGEVQPACVQSCPTNALTFGNLNDPNSAVSKQAHDGRAYKVLDRFINTQPSVSYLNRIRVEV